MPLALLLLGAANAFIGDNYQLDAGWHSMMFAVGQAAPVVLAAYRPLLAWAIEFAAFWVFAATVVPLQQPQPWPWVTTALLAYFVVQYAVARRHGPAIALLSWTIPLLAGILLSLNKDIAESRPNLQLVSILSALTLVLGSAIRMSANARARLAEEERLTAEERARRRMLEERTRIARELHDVVAHHMSVITVQASTAEYRLPDLSEAAREEFRSISDQARESLTEMRRLLTVLRSEDEAAQRAPQPGLDRLDDLVESAKRAGTNVTVTRRSVPEDLPEPVSLTAYRIVQEALSNVVRHASGADTTLTLTGTKSELRIDVVNKPPPGAAGSSTPSAGASSVPGAASSAPGRPSVPDAAVPDAAGSSAPSTGASSARGAATSSEPGAATSSEPGAATSSEPGAATSPEPGAPASFVRGGSSAPGAGASSVPGEPGLGLAGMRERVTLLGGLMETGPTPDGGFAVRVDLPTVEEAGDR